MDLLNSGILAQKLLDCLEDTFEANQKNALHLLSVIPQSQLLSVMTETTIDELLKRAFSYLTSGRTQDSLSAAYLLLASALVPEVTLRVLASTSCPHNLPSYIEQCSLDDIQPQSLVYIRYMHLLLNILSEQTKLAQTDLVAASQSSPLYPVLICMRYILSKADVLQHQSVWKSLTSQLLDITFSQILPVVNPVVCHSSPEGYLPDADSEDNEEPAGAAKDGKARRPLLPQFLVVCCWRTVKEISLMYGQVIETASSSGVSMQLLDTSQVVGIIKAFYESILLNAKHRGAFEMAYTGYCIYWQSIWKLSSYRHLVEGFLVDSPYSMLLVKDTADSLCATRRSAGLPFMVLAYTTTEPKLNNNAALRRILHDLMPMALYLTESGDEFSQNQRVHSLNVLRALFKTSALGEAVQPFVPQGLKAAITGYRSQVWPVRNASTLLFSALITRMFGVKHGKDDLSKQSGMAGRLFFQKYPEVHSYLLQELEDVTAFRDNSGHLLLQPSLYLLLLILCKLYPSQKESADTNLSLSVFIPYIHKCAASPVHKTRILAARALANVVSFDSLTQTISNLCHLATKASGHNELHGLFLQLYHLLAAHTADSESGEISSELSSSAECLLKLITDMSVQLYESNCDLVKAVFLDILLVSKPIFSTKRKTESNTDNKTVHTQYINSCMKLLTSPGEPSLYSAWTGLSVDLLLSKCNLLLDRSSPCIYDVDVEFSRGVISLLINEPSLYEAHHCILEKAIQDSNLPINLTDAVSWLNSWVKLDVTYNRKVSLSMVCGVITSKLPESANTLDSDQMTGIRSALASWDINTLQVLRLKALVCMEVTELSAVVYEVHSLLMNDTLSVADMLEAVEVVRLLYKTVVSTELTEPLYEMLDTIYQSVLLLVYGHEESVRGAAAASFADLFNCQPSDPHKTAQHILTVMVKQYNNKERLRLLWKNWCNNDYWISATSTMEDDDKEDGRPFSKGDTLLLCDMESFYCLLHTNMKNINSGN